MNGMVREIRVLVAVSDIKVTYHNDIIVEVYFNIFQIF